MEGVSHEAGLARRPPALDNLCWIYDNNHITIDGRTEIAYDDDVATRFIGYGWNVTTGRGRQRPRPDRAARSRGSSAEDERPTLIIVDSHIGYGLAAQAGHRRGPRRAARRGGGAGDQARLRLARGRRVPRPRGRLRALRRRDRQARRRAARRSGRSFRRATSARTRQLARRDRGDAAARAARRLGRRDPQLRPRREGRRDPQGVEPGRERDRANACRGCSPARPTSPARPRSGSTSTARATSSPAAATAASSTSGSASTSRRRSATGSRSRSCGRSWSTYLDLLRLRAAGDPALGADGAAGDPPLHPRLDRPRRGRPDPPAGRAARLAARDPGPRRDPALPTPTSRPRPGGWRWTAATGRWRWC